MLCSSSSDHLPSDDDFTGDERLRFQRSFIERHDILIDERYNLWLKKYCDNNTVCTPSANLPLSIPHSQLVSPSPSDLLSQSNSNLLIGWGIPKVSVLKKVLTQPHPQIAKAVSYENDCGTVLTSVDFHKKLKEKE